MKNNIELVKHCEMALNEKWGYVWGTFGNVLSEALLKYKVNQYPSGVGKYENFIKTNYLNKRTVDCIGLLKSYLWWNQGQVNIYNSIQDKSADMSFNSAKEKGRINDMPEIKGLILYKKGHVGVYIGNGKVIEARGTKSGVIKSTVVGSNSVKWTHWFKSPYIEYVKKKDEIATELPDNKIKITLMGEELIVDGFIENGISYILINKAYIPIRDIFEVMKLQVEWKDGVIVDVKSK